ncbi:MAG TPA: hypothetical protein VI076_17735 [Actinopolymorphaceae bacterium]
MEPGGRLLVSHEVTPPAPSAYDLVTGLGFAVAGVPSGPSHTVFVDG